MPSSHPERKPPTPTSQASQQKAVSDEGYASGVQLLRICWLLLGSTVFIVFGLTLFVILIKGPEPRATAPAEQTMAEHDKEMPPLDPKPATNDLPEESAQVLGGSFHVPPPEEAVSLAEAPPPLPPPPLRSQPTVPPQSSPQAPAPPTTPNPDVDFVKRLEASTEELRDQLLAVPELRLFSDLVVQNFREKEKDDEHAVKGMQRDQVDYAYNVQMNKYMRQAGLQEGLPLLSGRSCQLDLDTARMVQILSKDLRDMGFVSIPGAATRQNLSPRAKIEAFKEWCDINKVEEFRGALATLVQMLQVEGVPMRLLLVRELAKAPGPEYTAALATAALVDLSPEVRQAALAALEKRPSGQYVPVLLQGLRYPWVPVADHAALALRKLKPEGVVSKLVALLDRPDPSLPVLDPQTKKPLVRELVRLNHLRNCLLCHAPSANDKDGLVRGLVPTPGQPLPRLYYAGQKGNFVRADIAFLRQDFSVNLPVEAAAPWPSEQRFDFVTRVRPAKPEEMARIAAKPGNYPQRDAVQYALRGLTGKDGGEKSDKWCELLGIAKEERR